MAKSKEKQPDVQFQFIGIDILSSGYTVPVDFKEHLNTFTFEIATEIFLNPESKLAIVTIGVHIFSENKLLLLGNLKTSNVFLIGNYDEIISIDKEDKANLPDGVVVMLNSISLSTTRGVMWQTFKGTILHNALLPIVDPKNIIPQMKDK